MADKKISQLDSLTVAEGTDIIPIVDDPGGAPETKKITLADMVGSLKASSAEIINGTEDTKIVTPKGLKDAGIVAPEVTLNGEETLANKTLISPVLNTFTSNGGSITVPDSGNRVGLVVTQNDTTNNPNAVTITNAGTGRGLLITQNGDGVPLYIDNNGSGYSLIVDGAGWVGIGSGATTPYTPFCIDFGNVFHALGGRSGANNTDATNKLNGKPANTFLMGASTGNWYIYWTDGTTNYRATIAGSSF